MEVKNQDQKLKETNKSIAVSIKMLQDQLSQGIKIMYQTAARTYRKDQEL
jgi:hypothetical protein